MPNYTHLSDTYSQNTRLFENRVSSISMDYHHVPNLMAILGYSGIPHVQTDPYKHMKRIEQMIKDSFGISWHPFAIPNQEWLGGWSRKPSSTESLTVPLGVASSVMRGQSSPTETMEKAGKVGEGCLRWNMKGDTLGIELGILSVNNRDKMWAQSEYIRIL